MTESSIRRTLEDAMHVDALWDKFCEINPPPLDMPDDARNFYKWVFVSGMSTILVANKRLAAEPPERRARILEQLTKECTEFDATAQETARQELEGVQLNG